MNQDTLGLFRVAAACPHVRPADVNSNIKAISELSHEIEAQCSPSVITFPELSLTGYTCEEMFNQHSLYTAVEQGVRSLLSMTADLHAAIAVGFPIIYNSRRFNVAALLRGGRILGIIPKIYLPNNGEFYEARYFESGSVLGRDLHEIEYAGCTCKLGVLQIFDLGKARIAMEVCQDLWVPIPPCTYATLSGANVVLNLSASNEVVGKHDERKALLASTSLRLRTAYVYSTAGYGESTDDLVWAGSALIYENGKLLAENERFQKEASWIVSDLDLDALEQSRISYVNYSRDGQAWADAWPFNGDAGTYLHIKCGDSAGSDFKKHLYRQIGQNPFLNSGTDNIHSRCREAFNLQVLGLRSRLDHIRCSKCIIGVSGGLDSTLALLVCCEAFDRSGLDRKGIIGVTMPCFGTSDRTHGNANALMDALGITKREIDITDSVLQHFKDIGHDPDIHDVTYENSQARERTQVLMDLANAVGGIVVGTGDLSELALGWCTYNGDHMSMYSVNAGVPKTMIRAIVATVAEKFDCTDILTDIIDTPVSPELVPGAQMTEDIVGPYELHDFFLWHFFEGKGPEKIFLYACKAFEGVYLPETIHKWLGVFYRRFFGQQFKRSCLPDGPKICKFSLSPRGDWRMPTDASSALWMDELKKISIG